MAPAGPDRDIVFMFENHKLPRIGKPSTVATARGIGIGATAAQVRRAREV